MPLLQFDVTGPIDDADAFADDVSALYSKEMATSGGHIAISVRERAPGTLHLGRAEDGRILLCCAHIREGRSFERKRAFALAAMDAAADRWDVPEANMKVVFTEHEGSQMMGYDRVGGAWNSEEGAGEP